jgi:EAL domain-containing protein (putative c-di-GMP-specific phosphodiesterase class I)
LRLAWILWACGGPHFREGGIVALEASRPGHDCAAALIPVAEETGLADAIIAMRESPSLTVIAQGVGTGGQAGFLRTHDCDELRGLLFQPARLPADQFTLLLLA